MNHFVLAALMVAWAPASAQGQPAPQSSQPAHEPPTQRQLYERGETSVRSLLTDIEFPTSVGTLKLKQAREYSHDGEGIDSGLSFASDDGQVIGTIYLYYPSFAHAGAAAYATDRALAANSNTPLRRLGSTVVAAGGHAGAAIRNDYENYRNMASSAAFVKSGRWILKLRVSGPSSRAAEVSAAMTAMLDGLRFPAGLEPRAAAPLRVTDCPGSGPRAPASIKPAGGQADAVANGFLATFDPGGVRLTGPLGRAEALPSRVAQDWCVSGVTAASLIPILRSADGDATSLDGRSVVLVPLGDNGDMLEVVHAANLGGYQLLHHELGRTSVYGVFATLPSDDQIREFVGGAETPVGQLIAVVTHKPDGNQQVEVQAGAGRKGT